MEPGSGWSVVCRDATLRRSGGFLANLKCVLRDSKLSCTAKLAFGWLFEYSIQFQEGKLPKRNANGEIIKFDTVRQLKIDLGLSQNSDHTARRALKNLEERGLIESKRRGQGDPNDFFINDLRRIYPDDPDWPKMANQDLQVPPDLPILRIQEVTKTATLDLPNSSDQPFLANQDWAKLRDLLKNPQNSVRDWPEMVNPNVRTFERERMNENVLNEHEKTIFNVGQINLDGMPPGLAARLVEISEEIVNCRNEKRRNALEMLYIMLETFKDLQSEGFYMKIALNMTRAEISSGFEYVRNLEARNMIKKSRAQAFTDEMKRLAKESGIKITRK